MQSPHFPPCKPPTSYLLPPTSYLHPISVPIPIPVPVPAPVCMQSVSLILELCTGGELFDAIVRRKRYPEPAAARVIRAVVSVVHYMHSKGFMHCDLKPENVVLMNRESDTKIRVIDFGQAASFRPGKPPYNRIMTPLLFGMTNFWCPVARQCRILSGKQGDPFSSPSTINKN